MPLRILIAEDHEHTRSLMVEALRAKGYVVNAAPDGLAALEDVERWQPDLVLSDIQMPGLNGCEVCRHIKSNGQTRDLPVMLLSSLGDALQRANLAGADAFLEKPFKLEDLYSQVTALLRARTRIARTSNVYWDALR